jgi:hypothetical protein
MAADGRPSCLYHFVEPPSDVSKDTGTVTGRRARLCSRNARFFAVGISPKADAIGAQQALLLSQHTARTVKVHEVKELFQAMKDQA